jgi:hypothetical protein
MKLLVTAEYSPEEHSSAFSFRLGFKYRHRKGDFASSGYCRHTVAEEGGHELRLGCGVDCDGGGIEVALSSDDKSAIVRLQRVRIWQASKQDIESDDSLEADADDKGFQARARQLPRMRVAGNRPQGSRRAPAQVMEVAGRNCGLAFSRTTRGACHAPA